MNSFKSLKFKEKEINAVWKIISSILFLGNLKINSQNYIEGKIGCNIKKDINF